jgi:hypothetical protein
MFGFYWRFVDCGLKEAFLTGNYAAVPFDSSTTVCN